MEISIYSIYLGFFAGGSVDSMFSLGLGLKKLLNTAEWVGFFTEGSLVSVKLFSKKNLVCFCFFSLSLENFSELGLTGRPSSPKRIKLK